MPSSYWKIATGSQTRRRGRSWSPQFTGPYTAVPQQSVVQVDPDLATPNPIKIVVGFAQYWVIQTWEYGGLSTASYPNGAMDVLAAYVYPAAARTPLFQPSVAWYDAPNSSGFATQTGYAQGQLFVSVSNLQSGMLVPGMKNTLVVTWTPAANPGSTFAIARVRLTVEAGQIY